MQPPTQSPGWYVSRRGTQHGPYAWHELLAHSQRGLVAPGDRVYSPATGTWTKASQVPGLTGPTGKPLRSHAPLAWTASALVLVVVVALGVTAFVYRDRIFGDGRPDLGVASVVEPDPNTLVDTAEFGRVPPGQIGVMMAEGGARPDAEALAASLGGSVVGEIEYAGVYQIEYGGTTEADLLAALEKASADPSVEAAFPNEVAGVEAAGARCTPLDDPAYEGEWSRPHQMIGTQEAWDLIKASGIGLGKVHVGIVDDGLYTDQGEFDGGAEIRLPNADDPLVWPKFSIDGIDPSYSHGTGVATVIAADADDGGLTGIASPLGSDLTVTMTNKFYSGLQSLVATGTDPSDPTQAMGSDGQAWSITSLAMLVKQAKDGATVINCSWGSGFGSQGASGASAALTNVYRRFFEKMADDYPEVVFVCSAGNGGVEVDGDRRFPSGFALPNVVTVGNLGNDGDRWASSNMASKNYEVTIAAPGNSMPTGISPWGTVDAEYGGTSMAAPQVSAAIALMKAIDPALTAAEIKQILVDSGRDTIVSADGATEVDVPDSVGGTCLAVDQAVLAVINRVKKRSGQEEMSFETLLDMTVVDLLATEGEDGDWTIEASVPRMYPAGTMLTLRAPQSAGVAGASGVSISPGQVAQWTVTPGEGRIRVHVKRADTDSCWYVLIGTGVEVPADADGEKPQDATAAPDEGPITDVGAAIEQAAQDAGVPYARFQEHDLGSGQMYWSFLDAGGALMSSVTRHGGNAEARDYMRQMLSIAVGPSSSTFHGLPGYEVAPNDITPGGRGWVQGRYHVMIGHYGSGDYDAFEESVYEILDRAE